MASITPQADQQKSEPLQVFLSYKREDELRVGRIAKALEAEGFNLWWDHDLAGGERWRTQIQTALDSAGCVVVFWSEHSVGEKGDFVRDEATQAKQRNTLVPVNIDRVSPPLGFGEWQSIDLSRWKGKKSDPFFRDLCAAIDAKLAGKPVPPATGPRHRLKRRMTWGSVASALFISGGAIAFNLFGVQEQLCALPAGQPALSDVCGALHLGKRPSRKERLAWERVQQTLPGSCDSLRQHMAQFPNGHFHGKAAAIIAAKRSQQETSWHHVERRTPLHQRQSEHPSANQQAAQQISLNQAHIKAAQQCKSFTAGTMYQLLSAQAEARDWKCENYGAKVYCGFEGEAICQLKARKLTSHEVCG